MDCLPNRCVEMKTAGEASFFRSSKMSLLSENRAESTPGKAKGGTQVVFLSGSLFMARLPRHLSLPLFALLKNCMEEEVWATKRNLLRASVLGWQGCVSLKVGLGKPSLDLPQAPTCSSQWDQWSGMMGVGIFKTTTHHMEQPSFLIPPSGQLLFFLGNGTAWHVSFSRFH